MLSYVQNKINAGKKDLNRSRTTDQKLAEFNRLSKDQKIDTLAVIVNKLQTEKDEAHKIMSIMRKDMRSFKKANSVLNKKISNLREGRNEEDSQESQGEEEQTDIRLEQDFQVEVEGSDEEREQYDENPSLVTNDKTQDNRIKRWDNNRDLSLPLPGPTTIQGPRTSSINENLERLDNRREKRKASPSSTSSSSVQIFRQPIDPMQNLFTGLMDLAKKTDFRAKANLKTLYFYHGKEKENIDDWFFAMERYFKKANIHPREQTDFAVDYLRDYALTAYRSFKNDDMDWYEFKAQLLGCFQPKNLQKVLRKRLAALKQTGSVQEYIHDFDAIMN
jgi:hypothetical protein